MATNQRNIDAKVGQWNNGGDPSLNAEQLNRIEQCLADLLTFAGEDETAIKLNKDAIGDKYFDAQNKPGSPIADRLDALESDNTENTDNIQTNTENIQKNTDNIQNIVTKITWKNF